MWCKCLQLDQREPKYLQTSGLLFTQIGGTLSHMSPNFRFTAERKEDEEEKDFLLSPSHLGSLPLI